MILDGHIHINSEADPNGLQGGMQAAGVSGGVLISEPPACFRVASSGAPAGARLDNLMAWCKGEAEVYPFFWIDPMEEDALGQVARAAERGVAGFKVICSHHYPGDPIAMEVYAEIAHAGRPILFHSGILWDGKPSSGYCRPANFECLLEVPGLRFSLAHISWPWCDELIAVYGKFESARRQRPDLDVEMFVDVTPGTPPIYRRDALTKLLTVGYDIEDNVVFGTDCNTASYSAAWAREWIERDRCIYRDLELSDGTQDNLFCENLRRFIAR